VLPRLADRKPQLGAYALVERLAQGGMAAVYKAKLSGPSGFEKTMVVKALLPALCAHEELVELFSAEARLSAQLNHPNIVQVLDFGVEEHTPYLVMEYLDGWTLGQLRDRLAGPRKGRFPVGAAVKIARDVCLALGYAHNFIDRDGVRRQVIHRDVSPSNIMLCRDGTVKLLDFGIARVAAPTGTDLTKSFRGKYAYMAPEQVRRQPIDRRVDVFATGTVLHEMLTGKRLFASVSELETLERVAAAQVTAPSGENPDVPRALDAIVKKALSRDANGRYTSGAAMAEALDTLESLMFSRRKLAQLLKQIFPEAWAVVCEVCGKQVLPGRECEECGTLAPPAESSASDADVQPLPPPPRLPQRHHQPHLFVVPKLPSREDDSVKMGLTRPGHVTPARAHLVAVPSLADDVEDDPPTVETPKQPAPPPVELAAEWPAVEVSTVEDAPDLRGNEKVGRIALALLVVGLLGLMATLVYTNRPAPPVAEPAAVVAKPAAVVARPAAAPEVVKGPLIVEPVLVTRPAPPPPKVAHHHRRHAAPSSTVREGRLVDPFAGGE
jgi:serine/threonine protein kinase, bacterial